MTSNGDGGIQIRSLGQPGDLGWVVMAHGEQYAAEFGWDTTFEALVARIVADYAREPDPARAAAWIAEAGGRRVGCIFCVPAAPGPATAGDQVAQLRLLLVDPVARGHGLGDRLVRTCLGFARQAGYGRIRLWTNDVLAAARVIYLRHGFTLTAEEPHRSFGADLVGQTYETTLACPDPQRAAAQGRAS
jgi:GNAT superfamily N-acetyltransferase